MTRTKITIFALLALLITTNAWWTYQAFDQGVTRIYSKLSLEDHKQALDQTLSIFPVFAAGRGSRKDIIGSMEAEFGLSDGLGRMASFGSGSLVCDSTAVVSYLKSNPHGTNEET